MSAIKIKARQKNSGFGQNIRTEQTSEEIQKEMKEKNIIDTSNRVQYLLESVLSKLDILDGENFDNLFPVLLSSMKEAAKLRDGLIEEVGQEELKKNRPELFLVAKQIEIKYDNTVELFSEEEKRLERELASSYTKKKLTVYQR